MILHYVILKYFSYLPNSFAWFINKTVIAKMNTTNYEQIINN